MYVLQPVREPRCSLVFVCPKCGRQIGDPVGGWHTRDWSSISHTGNLVDGTGGLFLIPAVGLMTFGQSCILWCTSRAVAGIMAGSTH